MFLGGHTMTLGYAISDMGRVSIVVVTGFSFHALKDLEIKNPAPVKPAMTTRIQKSLVYFLDVEICGRPWIVEDSRKCLIFHILTHFVGLIQLTACNLIILSRGPLFRGIFTCNYIYFTLHVMKNEFL